MKLDLNIKKIANVYYTKTDGWNRDFFDTRFYDGIVLFDEGEIEYTFSDKKLDAKKGDFLFLPGNIPYSGKKLTETVAFYVIDFECFSSSEFSDVVGASVHRTYEHSILSEKFSRVVEMWKKQHLDVNFKMKAFIYSVLSDTVTHHESGNTTSASKILDYICENADDPSLCVKSLCEKFFISESQLRRNIIKLTGLKPNEYILKQRINMAKSELTYTSKSVGEISAGCGFSSQYYFSKCFTKHTGMTPSKYRMLTLT